MRRYASFWAPIDRDGEDLAQNFDDHKSSTELTDDALCRNCGYEFDIEDAVWGKK